MEKNHGQAGIRAHETIVWQADDFYYHPKSPLWYLSGVLISILVAVMPWLISGREDFISPIVILIALLGLIIYAGRKPRKKSFELSSSVLKVDSQPFHLSTFSRYWVETFDTHTQITFVGIKRTAMPVALCLIDKELAQRVLISLRSSLPESSPSRNPADWLTRKIKF